MKTYHIIHALVATLLCVVTSTNALSSPHKPLKRISHPATLGFDIVPRRTLNTRSQSWTKSLNPLHRRSDDDQLLHTDSFRLTLRAFDQTYHLHLRPNEALFHPNARINHYSPDGEITRTEPLLRSDYKVYEGEVVSPGRTAERWNEDSAGGLISPARRELGWARIIVHDQGDAKAGRAPVYEGAFSADGIVHHIKTRDNYVRHRRRGLDVEVETEDEHLVIFRDIDMGDEDAHPQARSLAKSCGHDTLDYNVNTELNPVLTYTTESRKRMSTPWYDPRRVDDVDPIDLDSRLVRRQNDISGNVTSNYIDRIGSHEGCKPTQSFIYMGVAADCEYVTKYGGAANATTQILNNWNSASALYKSTFNISMGIVELAVQDANCPASASSSVPWNVACNNNAVTLNDRLSLFSAWRGAKGGADGAGLWHLMSGCPTGTEVGVAWLGQLCNTESFGQTGNVVSGTGVSTVTITEWQVVAHEIGHNFGAIHDCADGCTLTDTCCPATKTACTSTSVFIMDAVSNVGENTFSPCSVGNICAAMETMNTTCLLGADSNIQIISKQMCGNGIVETGEECDPGKGNDSPCCDSTTCKFINGAVCDPKSSDCCTNSCQFAPATQVCRPSQDPTCDTAETCPGNSSDCPSDKTAADGTSCGGNGLACASGICTSPDLQCQQAGSSMGLTKACPASNDKSCQVSCQDPTNSQACFTLTAQLVNGSPCGYGGRCENNVCKAGSIADTIKAWYTQNLQISIPVTIVVGIVVLLILWRITTGIMGCCRRAKARRQQAAYKANLAGRQRLSSWVPPQGLQDNGENPPMRSTAPTSRLSRSGYVSPGMSYPPSHSDDYPDDSWQQGGQRQGGQRRNPSDGYPDDSWQQGGQRRNPSDGYNFEAYQLGQMNDGRRATSPEQQNRGAPGWVDDRAYNGEAYSNSRQPGWR
ncbi:hypothetical protein M407DRAFT_25853 [Tulasnella calospora MUT 4182]|uniref:Disintegrin and metalloproteinase domain-containing protein B n=1 Tax=Tulasnella calospora MUT 4182 TaxID=1051891 RepID=A0A0C3QFE0_9AGAM|nr:hypothetical protein M407DRAFT_25853 [Tulasnella calospora MUT 4182]